MRGQADGVLRGPSSGIPQAGGGAGETPLFPSSPLALFKGPEPWAGPQGVPAIIIVELLMCIY